MALSGGLAVRLRELGVPEVLVEPFLRWCRGTGYLDPADRLGDHDLAGRVSEFHTAVSLSAGRRVPLGPAPSIEPAPARQRIHPGCTGTPSCWTCEGVRRFGGRT
jgi:hypothetical protein